MLRFLINASSLDKPPPPFYPPFMDIPLSPAQEEAIRHASTAARALLSLADSPIEDLLAKHGLSRLHLDEAETAIRERARVVVHFHPDRVGTNGLSVAQSLSTSGLFQNQFETGLSNGSLTPFLGGPRDTWEKQLFGSVYQQPHLAASERPKYGALDLTGFSDGPAPRFGSCYLRLKPAVSRRCTFSDRDSYLEPSIYGTFDCLHPIIATLLLRTRTDHTILGIPNPGVPDLLKLFTRISNNPVNFASRFGRTLDDYIEAQIHGPIRLREDVEALVADPSFRDTKIEHWFESICSRFDVALDWHGGFQLEAHEVPPGFRGPRIPVLAQRVADHDLITAAAIGRAAVSLTRNRESWLDWGSYEETLQHLKQLWHVLAFYGRPLVPPT